MIDKINSLIGKPYHPENYNCYHLVRELVPKAPDYEMVMSRLSSMRLFNQEVFDTVTLVTDVKDGDIVLLGRSDKHLHHAGVYFGGYIVHADKPSVRAVLMADMLLTYPAMRYYRCK